MEIQYTPHEQLMLNEREELEARIFNLNTLLNKGQPEDMDDCDWDLLNSQAFSMRHYNFMLNARIRRFKKKYKNVETKMSKANLVNLLRVESGFGLIECKNTLQRFDWNIETAKRYLISRKF